MELLDEIWARVLPDQAVALSGRPVLVVLALAVLAVSLRSSWQVLRLVVTLVHELGHAAVGVLVGRRFTGFVLRGDMSGHAVTVGPTRGAGRALTTWAGYPAPALVGAAAIWLAVHGWAAPVLTVVLVVLAGAALRVRSALTAVVVVVAILAAGALWWWATGDLQAQVVVAVGVVLLVGAWRHLGAVVAAPDRAVSDPGVLARLTPVPRGVWNATFAVALGACTWAAARTLLTASGILLAT
jgi:Peptidase M50B-like